MSGVPLARRQLHRFFFGFLVPLRVVLGAFWGTLGPLGSLGVAWGPLRSFGRLLRRLGSFEGALGALWGSFGELWAPFGGPLGVLWGSFGGLVGVLRGSLGSGGRPGAFFGSPWGFVRLLGRFGVGFRDFPGNSGRPFGSILSSFLVFVRSLFGVCFLSDF